MNILVMLSGGTGLRMNMQNMPKQYLLYRERPIISYSLKTFDDCALIDQIVIVAAPEWRDFITEWMQKEKIQKFYAFADPGENRALSILNGMRAAKEIADAEDTVIVHDAARPLVSEDLIRRCLQAMPGHDGVMPGLPAKDTYYLALDDRVTQMLPRNQLVAGQAPEFFRFGAYLRIYEDISKEDILTISGSTEIAMRYGFDIVVVPGEERNFKITTQDDIKLLDSYME